jgi:hypothetical protein
MSGAREFAPEFAKPGSTLAMGSGAQPFAAAFEKFPALEVEPEATAKTLDRFGLWLRFMLTQNNVVPTVASSAFAIALAQEGAVGPRLYAFDRALTNTLNVRLPVAGLATNFTASEDGSFDFSIERPDGQLETIVALVSRQQGEPVLARAAEFRREDYAENLPDLVKLAASRGLNLTSAESSDASARARDRRVYISPILRDEPKSSDHSSSRLTAL